MSTLPKGKCESTETALHTHDSISWKRCRRKWFFSSPFSMHLQPKPAALGVNPHLWFGSGFHWAMEDYYGKRKFPTALKAFEAYVNAFKPAELPADIDSLIALGNDMLSYATDWMDQNKTWKTVYVDGEPLVEVPFSLVLKEASYYELEDDFHVLDRYFYVEQSSNEDGFITPPHWESARTERWITEAELIDAGAVYHEVVFHGKLDAIVENAEGEWWILDYKTAKAFDTGKLDLDPQISKYCWAAEQYLDHEISGMVYVQVSKSPPKAPKITTKGISTDQRQRTTHALYRKALLDMFGDIKAAPAANITFLNNLADEEDEHGNKFVRIDWVERNDAMKVSTYQQIIAEARDMLHPGVRIYMNPTKDCSWDCPFKTMCTAMEEGADWRYYLDDYEVRNETMKSEVPSWEIRMYKNHPDLFPEEYAATKEISVDTVEDFLNKYGEDE